MSNTLKVKNASGTYEDVNFGNASKFGGQTPDYYATASQMANITHLIYYDASITDYTNIIQTQLDKKGHVKLIGAGTWITGRLQIGSNTTFELGEGVILKKKDGTKHVLLNNKGHVTGAIDENITLIGGKYDLNGSGQSAFTGNLLSDPQSWAGQGIIFDGVNNLTIKNIKEIGNEQNYCILIANVTGLIIDNIYGNSIKDCLHLQVPIKNAKINNIRGYFQDDTVSLTAGDYKAYSLGNYGNFENIEITNVVGEKYDNTKSIWQGGTNGNYTDELIKMVGSGIDGLSIFKNIKVSGLTGGCTVMPVCILREDTFDGNTALQNTVLENVVIENIDMESISNNGYISVGAKNGDITIKNLKINQYYRLIHFNKAELDNVIIDGIYNVPSATPVTMNWGISFDSGSKVKRVTLENMKLDINVDTASPYALMIQQVDDSIGELNIDKCYFNAAFGTFYYSTGTPTIKTNIRISNSYIKDNAFIYAANTMEVYLNNSYVEAITSGITLAEGCDVSVFGGNSIIKNAKLPYDPSATRKIRMNGIGIEYPARLSLVNNMKAGDFINCTDNTEPTGSGIVYYDGANWGKAQFMPNVVTQAVSLGTINAYSSKELAFNIAKNGPNRQVDCNPTFAIPDGIIWMAYNRDYNYIRLRVANVTASAITIPDGDWIFRNK